MRKKKNADAQAAFRARRANYIATLEETGLSPLYSVVSNASAIADQTPSPTSGYMAFIRLSTVFAISSNKLVTSLEQVVVQLQDSCRQKHNDNADLRRENDRLSAALDTLRRECREREKYLRAVWHSRRAVNGSGVTIDDFPPPPPSFAVSTSGTGSSSSSLGTPVQTPLAPPVSINHYTTAGANGSTADGLDVTSGLTAFDQTTTMSLAQAQDGYGEAPGSAYSDRSPVLTFMGPSARDQDEVNGRGAPMNLAKMPPYASYASAWTTSPTQTTAVAPGSDPLGNENGSSASQSPAAYIPSPTLTANEINYGAAAPRYTAPMHDASKGVVPGVDTVPYMLNNGDRSISPIATSPHAPMGHYPFAFPTTETQDHSDADYHSRLVTAPELRLHGGTADISAYGMNRRRTNTGPERPMLGTITSYNATKGEPGTSSPGAGGLQGPTSPVNGVRRRRDTGTSNGAVFGIEEHSSRSPSPPTSGHPLVSSTLAVIKAQAFGALRRTRARSTKKAADNGSVKLALGALEARAIGLGLAESDGQSPSNKRMRMSDDDGGQL